MCQVKQEQVQSEINSSALRQVKEEQVPSEINSAALRQVNEEQVPSESAALFRGDQRFATASCQAVELALGVHATRDHVAVASQDGHK